MNHKYYLRIASAVPKLDIANIQLNVTEAKFLMKSAFESGASIILFPELSLTGYSCGDLFFQDLLLTQARQALIDLAAETAEVNIIAVVGLPILLKGRLYNCAAFLNQGKIVAIIPKIYLPMRHEYYEQRWFTSGLHLGDSHLQINNNLIPIGCNFLFEASNIENCIIGIEICEDLWSTLPPSGTQAVSGASILLNLSASNELLGKKEYRNDLVRLQSARCLAGYVYVSSGPGESSTDVVYSGHSVMAENGTILAESNRFQFDSQIIYADFDIQHLQHERICNSSYATTQLTQKFEYISVNIPQNKPSNHFDKLLRANSPMPFVPNDLKLRKATCEEIFSIQSTALARRIRHIGCQKLVIGLSGGLDSTLALLVMVHAFDKLSLKREDIIAVTIPGLGTTSRTQKNAEELAQLIGAELRVISLNKAIQQHFEDINHDASIHDVTFENSQARERTQILMDLANQVGGFVIGTGDLSEAALGWCTFNADHMSMYHVNIGVPKTLVKYIIEWCAESDLIRNIAHILQDICDTPITPELIPPSKKNEIVQLTEEIVGPYELHDYFLFHLIRYGERPEKIFFSAEQAFKARYSALTILHWLDIFLKRFFTQQFKRSVMPDGPKVGSVALSPRGDWRMPSDVNCNMWLEDIKLLRSKVLSEQKNTKLNT